MGVINAILPILALLCIGYISKKKWITDDKFWFNINSLVYYFMFPCLMIKSIGMTNFQGVEFSFIGILIAIVLIFMIMIWISKPIFKDEKFWISFIQGAVRYNSYIFITITYYYVGEASAPIIALITAFLVMTTNIISVFVLNFYSEKKLSLQNTIFSTIKNPLILSCIGGLVINQLAIYMPAILEVIWFNALLSNIGDASLVLSLIGVGASLSFISLKNNINGILACSFIKLILLPFSVFVTLIYFKFPSELIVVCVIYAGAPCSSNATAMTQKMGGDYESMSTIISIQTLLSLVTLTVMLLILNKYGIF